MENQSRIFEDWIDEVYSKDAESQHSSTGQFHSYTFEITINYPAPELSLIEHIQSYKDLWAQILNEYNGYNDLYEIEFCRSGQAHLHGTMAINLPLNTLLIEDEHILDMMLVSILKKLPIRLWKTNKRKRNYNPGFRMIKTPAVCLNLKNVLASNWKKYIEKTRV